MRLHPSPGDSPCASASDLAERMTRAGHDRQSVTGFTLVELLVVAVVLAIFAAVVVPQFGNTTDEAKLSALRADLASMRTAIDLYYQQHGHYPGATPARMELCNGLQASPFTTQEQAGFNFQLTAFSATTGEVCSRKSGIYVLGPYLRADLIPANPITGNRAIRFSANGTLSPSTKSLTGGWLMDTVSGRLIADHADYEQY